MRFFFSRVQYPRATAAYPQVLKILKMTNCLPTDYKMYQQIPENEDKNPSGLIES